MSSVTLFSSMGLALVLGLRYVKDTRENMDWLADGAEYSRKPDFSGIEPNYSLREGLAALGMTATAPRQARRAKRPTDALHPAADEETDVVHIKRVSEEEEAERMSTEAGAATLRRIGRELVEIQQNPSPDWAAESVLDNLLEWHFTLRGPTGTDFENGIYHGRIVLPINYPFAPPSISLLTPSGRFEVNRKICLSISNFHPELWQPAWGVRTMLEALRSFLPSPADGAVGSLEWPPDMRRQLAAESLNWVCPVCAKANRDILPTESHKVEPQRTLTTEATCVVEPVPIVTRKDAPVAQGNWTLNLAILVLVGLIVALLFDIFIHG